MRWREYIDDNQWDDIERLSGLPPHARSLIGGAIRMFRGFSIGEKSAMRPSNILGLIKSAESRAKDLVRRLAPLLHELSISTETRGELDKVHEALASAQKVLANERSRFRNLPPRYGPKTAALIFLVDMLDIFLFQHIGHRISRSTNYRKGRNSGEYVRLVCQIADPSISKQRIERAMKFVIKSRRRENRLTPPDTPWISPDQKKAFF
jgi:hypothetical protein